MHSPLYSQKQGKMPSDDERDSKATKLKDREGFLSWKRTMRLVAMGKGDIVGIFDKDGTKDAGRLGSYSCGRSWRSDSAQMGTR